MSSAPQAIRHQRDFAALSASRDRGRSGPIRVVRAPDAPDGGVAVAYALGRSVGSAVVRNRIRRRLRVLMRERLHADVLVGGRYLVSVSPAGANATYDELGRHLDAALAQLS
ncbi:MAG: ribonuclease P protein component [Acidimicrobiales bacterium]|nr:ribonuclease P protein component [Acidimicrobiales bacterium]